MNSNASSTETKRAQRLKNLHRICASLALLMVLASMGPPPQAADSSRFVTVQGKDILAPDGSKLLLRGINLGNWLVPEGYMFHFNEGPASAREISALIAELIGPDGVQAFWDEYRKHYITQVDIDFIKKAGFNSIRIPFNYRLLTPEAMPGKWEEPGFELLDRAIGWCRNAGLWVILDMHCAPGGQTGTNIDDSWGYPWLFESTESQQRTIEVWRKIAERYHNDSTVLGYELLNEPIPHFPGLEKYNALLEPLYRRICAAIREVDSNHIVILGGAQWNSNFKVFGAPFDSKLMYAFHRYWTPPTQELVRDFLEFRDKYHVPVWMGESGENTDDWILKFRQVLESNQIGWCFWPYKKMDATSCVASFERPAYWDEVLDYAKLCGGVGGAEGRITKRPSLEHARASFADFLKKCRFENCCFNEGYLKALGMK